MTGVEHVAGSDAFAAWVRPCLPAMTRLARRLVPPGEADDVVQDALERAWAKWWQYDPGRGTPTVWLLAITADRARHAHRRATRRRATAERATASAVAAAGDPGSQLAEDLDLEKAITALSRRQRCAVALYYFLDVPVGDVAAIMGCSPGTVKSTLFDARSALRRLLGDDDHAER